MLNVITTQQTIEGGDKALTNTDLLREKIKDSGLTLFKICEVLGMTYATFRGRVNNQSAFTAPEISALVELFHLSRDEADQIFFAQMRE